MNAIPKWAEAAVVTIRFNDGKEILGAVSSGDLYQIGWNLDRIWPGYAITVEQTLKTLRVQSRSIGALEIIEWCRNMEIAERIVVAKARTLTVADVGAEEAGSELREGERLVRLMLMNGERREVYDLSATSVFRSHASTSDWLIAATLLHRDPITVRRSGIIEEIDITSSVSRHRP